MGKRHTTGHQTRLVTGPVIRDSSQIAPSHGICGIERHVYRNRPGLGAFT